MRIVRHLTPAGPAWAALQPDGSALALEGPSAFSLHPTSRAVSLGKRLAPLEPTNIIGIGLNYRQHAAEGGKPVPARPMWFMKTADSIQNPEDPIKLPPGSATVDYEGELAVVLGRTARDVAVKDSLSYILGYTVANDVSARDWQFELGGGQFNHGKSFDTFCPMGPELVTPEILPDPQSLRIVTRVNGEVRQDSSTSDMVFDVATLISFLSTSRTLSAGTVILTGTPQGVGYARRPPVWLKSGDSVSVAVEGIGTLTNPVVAQ